MDLTQLQSIIDMLPQVLIYVCPGYITLWIYNAVISRKVKESNHMVAKAIIISYLYLEIIKQIKRIIPNLDENITLFILTIVTGVCVDKVLKSEWYSRILYVLNISASTDTDIIDKIRTPQGVWVKVYLDDLHRAYEGCLTYDIMDPEVERHLILSSYLKYKISDDPKILDEEAGTFTELEIIEDNSNDLSSQIVLKYDSITRIEVV